MFLGKIYVSCTSLSSKSEVTLAFSEEVGNLVSPVVAMHPKAPEVHSIPWLPKNWHLFLYSCRTFQLQASTMNFSTFKN